MKKVLLYAYTALNLGDDLFIKILLKRYPNSFFYLKAPKIYRDIFKAYKNLEIIETDKINFKIKNQIKRRLLKKEYLPIKVNKVDLILEIGGSLFMENENWKNGLAYRKKRLFTNSTYFLLGCNFGPYSSEEFYKGYKNLFLEYNDICFRDQKSYDLFKDLNNTRLESDIVFQLKKEIKRSEKEDNSIVISIIKPSIRKELNNIDEKYFKYINFIVSKYVNLGYKVSLIAFCEMEGDLEYSKFYESQTNNINLIKYTGTNMDEIINLFQKASVVYASRFHAMILGWVCGKYVFPIVYSDKMLEVIKDCAFKGNYIDIRDLNKEDVIENMDNFYKVDENSRLKNSEIFVKSSDNQFLKLDAILNNNENEV